MRVAAHSLWSSRDSSLSAPPLELCTEGERQYEGKFPGHWLGDTDFLHSTLGVGGVDSALLQFWFSDKALGLNPWQPAPLTSVQPFLPLALSEQHILCLSLCGSLCAAGLGTQERDSLGCITKCPFSQRQEYAVQNPTGVWDN